MACFRLKMLHGGVWKVVGDAGGKLDKQIHSEDVSQVKSIGVDGRLDMGVCDREDVKNESSFYIGGSPLTIMVITGRKSRHLGTEIMSFIGIH